MKNLKKIKLKIRNIIFPPKMNMDNFPSIGDIKVATVFPDGSRTRFFVVKYLK